VALEARAVLGATILETAGSDQADSEVAQDLEGVAIPAAASVDRVVSAAALINHRLGALDQVTLAVVEVGVEVLEARLVSVVTTRTKAMHLALILQRVGLGAATHLAQVLEIHSEAGGDPSGPALPMEDLAGLEGVRTHQEDLGPLVVLEVAGTITAAQALALAEDQILALDPVAEASIPHLPLVDHHSGRLLATITTTIKTTIQGGLEGHLDLDLTPILGRVRVEAALDLEAREIIKTTPAVAFSVIPPARLEELRSVVDLVVADRTDLATLVLTLATAALVWVVVSDLVVVAALAASEVVVLATVDLGIRTMLQMQLLPPLLLKIGTHHVTSMELRTLSQSPLQIRRQSPPKYPL